MTATILTSIKKKKVASHKHAAILLTVVFLNIAIWFVEQMIYTEFEFLAVSYIVSEMLLLMLYGMMQDYGIMPLETNKAVGTVTAAAVNREEVSEDGTELALEEEVQHTDIREADDVRIEQLAEQWSAEFELTRRETEVLCALLKNKKRKEIAEELFITEHTVKKHTGNVFSKLGVSSREELFQKSGL